MRSTIPAVFIFLLATCRLKSFSQQLTNRSVYVKAIRDNDSTKPVHRYTMHIINLTTDSIICITHSYNILLIDGYPSPENILVPHTPQKDTNEFALYYSRGDTLITPETYPDKLSTLLLPLQRLQIDFGITGFTHNNYLLLEYITLPDVCYKAFTEETLNGGNWVRKYNTQYMKVELE